MWRQLLALTVCLANAVWAQAELPEAQRRGLQVALEEFHKHPPVQWAFRETGVSNASDTTFPAGTFVRLEFKLQQTNCRKKDWRSSECKVKPNGSPPPASTPLSPHPPPPRKRKCLACIKLDSEGKVLARMVYCPVQTQAQREPQERLEAQCSKVERTGEDPHSLYFPGQFAFFKAQPPH